MSDRGSARRAAGWRVRMVAGPGAALALAITMAGCSNSTGGKLGGAQTAPGVTSSSITVGSIADISGPLSADFAPISSGVQAYFSMVNAAGGVDGRKLVLAAQKDDQGSSSQDLTVSQQLVEQNHVFAVVGVGTPFFGGASYLAQLGVPTFGYQVSSDWSDGPSLFGAFGSYLAFDTGAMGFAYAAEQLHATSVGLVAYAVPQSAAACQATANGFASFGISVGYQDLSFGFGADPTADVLQMRSHGVDVVFTCLDVSGNVAFARSISQNGLAARMVWLNGYDRSTVQQYGSLLNGTVIALEHVPFEAAEEFPGTYPAFDTYLKEMKRYQPAHVYDEVAFDGWVDAVHFVDGLKAVGRNLTQAKLVTALNAMTAYTADGLVPPENWTQLHTSAGAGPFCGTSVQVVNGAFQARVHDGSQVFYCFDRGSDVPVLPPAGTPGVPGS